MKTPRNIIIHIKIQTSHNLFHQIGRLQSRNFILYISLILKQPEIAEILSPGRLTGSLILDHDRSRSRIDLRSAQQINHSSTHTYHQREQHPRPVMQCPVQYIRQRHGAARVDTLPYL